MKLASFNINDINRRLTDLLNWLRQPKPTLFAFRNSRRRCRLSGGSDPGGGISCSVARREAILARWAPILTRVGLPGDATDKLIPLSRSHGQGLARRLDLRTERESPSRP
jgi:exodeoxyribonuclease-3